MTTKRSKRRTRAIVSMRRQYDRAGLIRVLRAAGIPMPRDARVYVNVPGGGDYSNCMLDLTEGVTVTISTKPYDQKR